MSYALEMKLSEISFDIDSDGPIDQYRWLYIRINEDQYKFLDRINCFIRRYEMKRVKIRMSFLIESPGVHHKAESDWVYIEEGEEFDLVRLLWNKVGPNDIGYEVGEWIKGLKGMTEDSSMLIGYPSGTRS